MHAEICVCLGCRVAGSTPGTQHSYMMSESPLVRYVQMNSIGVHLTPAILLHMGYNVNDQWVRFMSYEVN